MTARPASTGTYFNGSKWKVVDLVMRISVLTVMGVCIPWGIFVTTTAFELEKRQALIEAKELPPPWLRNDVTDLKTSLLDIQSRLRRIEIDIEKLKGR